MIMFAEVVVIFGGKKMLEINKIHCGDCLELMNEVGGIYQIGGLS